MFFLLPELNWENDTTRRQIPIYKVDDTTNVPPAAVLQCVGAALFCCWCPFYHHHNHQHQQNYYCYNCTSLLPFHRGLYYEWIGVVVAVVVVSSMCVVCVITRAAFSCQMLDDSSGVLIHLTAAASVVAVLRRTVVLVLFMCHI